MNFCTILLLVTTGAVLFGTSDGLKCWICSSLADPKKCGDDTFSGESSTIQKKNCDDVPAYSPPGASTRTSSGTACAKIKLEIHGQYILTRTCASPGDFGTTDMKSDGCTTFQLKGTGEAHTCFCKGDYCNGSGMSGLAAILVVLPFTRILSNVF